jgi:hypothetical protein
VAKTKPTASTAIPRWVIKHSLLVGIALALICQVLPEDYRRPCNEIAHICTGGITQ